jgi:hypothetical protein
VRANSAAAFHGAAQNGDPEQQRTTKAIHAFMQTPRNKNEERTLEAAQTPCIGSS